MLYATYSTNINAQVYILVMHKNETFGCDHFAKKALFPVRSTLVKLRRAVLSSVVGDHMRNYSVAIFFLKVPYLFLVLPKELISALKTCRLAPFLMLFLFDCNEIVFMVFCEDPSFNVLFCL